MSTQSGITTNEQLAESFSSKSNCLFVKIEIQNDTFVITGEGQKTSSSQDDFASINAVLEKKAPAYVLYRISEKDWLCISYIPDGSPVRLKMIYASSKSALKQGLGNSKFFKEDWAISDNSECNDAEYQRHMLGVSREVAMSYDERMHSETVHQTSHTSGESRVSAIVGIPIKVADSVIDALNGIKNGQHDTVELIVDPVSEILNNATPNNAKLQDLPYPEKEPRFFVHNFSHQNDGEMKKKLILIYFCPSKAIPKHKMLYSTCKANIIKLLKNLEIDDFNNFETDVAGELTDEIVLQDIYPKVAEDKSFKKPSARGRGKQTLAKFQSN